ncbi:FGGY carbohydrate kinase domain-containing [Brachionus plicatilis]|uniref:FGGY carbohydrate kinase domain-containing n=1 Tax=Brachionus plicatilis TaxID=10195 RepID=A0A3M7QLI3_BRAPC|nr:FGGY carbohydrate kinase domain-containing [Brachionus plicatilis]
MAMKYYMGVDVGTSSVRVGLFDQNGILMEQKTEEITVFNFKQDYYEQSSSEIIEKINQCINFILDKCPVGENVLSIGFDATCSLVILDKNYQPLSVSDSEDPNINIIMWMDHRAIEQAEFINSTNYEALKNVGGSISPEMDPPKILWLKQNKKSSFQNASHFFSLPDFLVWKFSGKSVRSVCSVTCKWLFKSKENKWDVNFWQTIDLDELTHDNFARIGSKIEKPLKYCDTKILDSVSKALGLNPETKIGVSMIDAHAGGVGGICLTYGYLNHLKESKVNVEEILVLVSGTSSCFMATSKEPKFIKGIWGPYFEAMVPNMWLNEGGQSASGKLLDHVITTHPSYSQLKADLGDNNSVYNYLNDYLKRLAEEKKLKNLTYLTKDVHVYPDFHGNRSPLADPIMKGQIIGLGLDTSLQDLAIKYLATVQALAYQTRHIIEEMNSQGIDIKIISLIGGLIQNSLYTRTVCDVCNVPVLFQNGLNSSIILGAALLGAASCDFFREKSFEQLISDFGIKNQNAMNCSFLRPDLNTKMYHQTKYEIYKLMLNNQIIFRSMMKNF